MKFKFIHNFRILQITQASEVEMKQLDISTTATWTSFNGKTREKHSKSYMHNYKFIAGGFWHKLMALRQMKYTVAIENINDMIHDVSLDDFTEWSCALPLVKTPRWYQIKGAWLAVKYRISRGEFATSAGKSLILYLVARYCIERRLQDSEKILIVVPSVMLVKQLAKDFDDYQTDNFLSVDKIHGGSKRNKDARIVIGNIDALINYDYDFFQQFGAIFYDEAHKLKSVGYQQIIGNYMHELNLKCIYAVSGTFYPSEDSQDYPAEAISGPILMRVGAKQLMDEGSIADLKISIINIKHTYDASETYYNHPDCQVSQKRYHFEMSYIRTLSSRIKILSSIISKIEFNQLILVKSVAYCKLLTSFLTKMYPNKSVHMIHGDIDGAVREEIKVITENNLNVIIVATFATMSTGVSINNLSALHIGESAKSFIMVRQSIGRTLRLHPSKAYAQVYDYVDIFSRYTDDWGGPKSRNIAYVHSKARIKIYAEQKFEYHSFTYSVKS